MLAALGAAGTAAALVRYWPEQGFINPCRALLPPELTRHALIGAAWEGIDARKAWDCHVHLVGTGDSGSGIRINPAMESLANPLQYAQRLFYLNAGCAHDAPGRVDESYLERMRNLVDGLAQGAKLLLFALDCVVDASGEERLQDTSIYVPNRYAAQTARRYPDYFEWAASIHPYRRDCVERLASAHAQGARAVKWLPSAMGMDPASRRCDRFYAELARRGLPLITHAGRELAIGSAFPQNLGNPLRLRRALEHGVRVVVAHCASLGADIDLDAGPNAQEVESFSLFARLMEEPRWKKLLFGDLSALPQVHRAVPYLERVLERAHWHARLLNGSDYPLPGVMPIYSVERLAERGLIERTAAPVLKRIREHSPLLFDFVLKRSLRLAGRGFPASVFETRGFFEPHPNA
ncbi:MAG: amidohydrolase family protein [Betaproteobacteria bacterium]|nr:amidohydrolase family protein [Betaproteobacteria bacterium]